LSVSKKTVLLQAEASACVSGLANVLFCALAFHYLVFISLSLCSKLSVVSVFFLHLAVTVAVWLVRDCGLFTYRVTINVGAGYTAPKTTETLINYTACCMLVFIAQSQFVRSFCKSNILS
jgi:hypothetical protein